MADKDLQIPYGETPEVMRKRQREDATGDASKDFPSSKSKKPKSGRKLDYEIPPIREGDKSGITPEEAEDVANTLRGPVLSEAAGFQQSAVYTEDMKNIPIPGAPKSEQRQDIEKKFFKKEEEEGAEEETGDNTDGTSDNTKSKGGGFLEFFGLAGGRKRRRRKKSRKKKKSKKRKSRRRSRRRRGGDKQVMDMIYWNEENEEPDAFNVKDPDHKERLFARIYKWYLVSNENEEDEEKIQEDGEKIKKAFFWNDEANNMDDKKLEMMKTSQPKTSILKEGWTVRDLNFVKKDTTVAITFDGARIIRDVFAPINWPPEINPAFIKIGNTYRLLTTDRIMGLPNDGHGIYYHKGNNVILDPNNTKKSSGFGKSRYKYRYKKTNKVARGKPCEKTMVGRSMCEPGYKCDRSYVTHQRGENKVPVCFKVQEGGRRRRKKSRRRKSRRKSKKRKSRKRSRRRRR